MTNPTPPTSLPKDWSRAGSEGTAAYRWVVRLGRALLCVMRVRPTVYGDERVPRSGAAIVAISHFGHLDFVMAQWAVWSRRRRYVRFLSTAAAFRHPVSGPLMRAMRHVPVDRNDGAGAYRQARSALAEGSLVGVFPEAQVSGTFTLLPFKTGAARLAIESGRPLVPCVVWGAHRILTRTRRVPLWQAWGVPVIVAFGTPLHAQPGEDHHQLTERTRAAMHLLLEAAMDEYPLVPKAWWVPAHRGGSAPGEPPQSTSGPHTERPGGERDGAAGSAPVTNTEGGPSPRLASDARP